MTEIAWIKKKIINYGRFEKKLSRNINFQTVLPKPSINL